MWYWIGASESRLAITAVWLFIPGKEGWRIKVFVRGLLEGKGGEDVGSCTLKGTGASYFGQGEGRANRGKWWAGAVR